MKMNECGAPLQLCTHFVDVLIVPVIAVVDGRNQEVAAKRARNAPAKRLNSLPG
jgi:hypothetical protein